MSNEEQKREMEMAVLEAVGEYGVPAVIEAIIKACVIAYEMEESQEPVNWPKLESYRHFAKRLDEIVH